MYPICPNVELKGEKFNGIVAREVQVDWYDNYLQKINIKNDLENIKALIKSIEFKNKTHLLVTVKYIIVKVSCTRNR